RDAALQLTEDLRKRLEDSSKPKPAAGWTYDAGRGQRSESEELILLIDALRAAIRVLTKDLRNMKCPCGADAAAGTVAFHCIQPPPEGASPLDRKEGPA